MIRFLQTPGRTKKIVLGGLLLVICGAMVITLVPGGMLGDAFGFGGGGLGQNVLAKVGDREISVTETQELARNMGRQQFRGNLPEELMPFLIQRAADSLIMQKALLTEAERLGLHVTDAEVQDELQHSPIYGPTLFPGGKFIGDQAYQDLLSQNNLSVGQFEQGVKDDILRRKLIDMVTGPVTVSSADLQVAFRKQNAKVKFDYAVLTADDLKKQIHPTDAELKAYYDRNKQMYVNSIPEKRSVRYVVIDTAKVASQVHPTPEQLQRYYNEHMDQYRTPEQVNVRHILIKTPVPGPDGKVDQKAVDAARQKAQDVLKQLQGGASFADLAKKYSEDPGSAKNGGSLGWIGRGRTVPEFEKTAFSLAKGATSGIVQSNYGFHIIHVDDKQDAHLKSLNEVRAQIEPIVAQDLAAQQAQNRANNVESQARTAGLDKAAAGNGLQVTTAGPVTRTDSLPGLGTAPEVMDAIFSAQVNGAPDMTNVKQAYVVYQVTQIVPPRTPSFEESKSRVESEFLNERASTMLAQKTQELADRAKAQHDLKKAAKEVGASIKSSQLVTEKDQVPDVGAMSGPASVVFSMKPGEISNAINNGNTGVVVSLLEKQEPTPAEFDKGKDQVRDQLVQQKRNELTELFAVNLKDQLEKAGKIRVNQSLMKQLTSPRNQEGS